MSSPSDPTSSATAGAPAAVNQTPSTRADSSDASSSQGFATPPVAGSPDLAVTPESRASRNVSTPPTRDTPATPASDRGLTPARTPAPTPSGIAFGAASGVAASGIASSMGQTLLSPRAGMPRALVRIKSGTRDHGVAGGSRWSRAPPMSPAPRRTPRRTPGHRRYAWQSSPSPGVTSLASGSSDGTPIGAETPAADGYSGSAIPQHLLVQV